MEEIYNTHTMLTTR